MPKRSSRQRDYQELARDVPNKFAPDAEPPEKPTDNGDDGKNPAAVALGRLGGKKGGLARAAKLTKKQRSEIARKAAQARWKNKNESE